MNSISVLITSIARPEMLLECVKAWKSVDCVDTLVAEQGEITPGVAPYVKEHYALPWDSGISVGRNHLVGKALKMGYKHVLMAADSIYPGNGVNRLLSAVPLVSGDYKLLGLAIERRMDWTYRLSLGPKSFVLSGVSEPFRQIGGFSVVDCDICCNFFLADAAALNSVGWDENVKAAEHQDFFWRFKAAGHRCLFTRDISGRYVGSRSGNYGETRRRNIRTGDSYMLKKYGISKHFETKP